MTPLSTVLPPPSPTWDFVYQWPAEWGESTPGDIITPFDRNGALRPGPGHEGLVSGNADSNSIIVAERAPSVRERQIRHGRPCGLLQITAGGAGGAGALLPSYTPAFDGSGLRGHVNSSSAVGVFDFNVSLEFAVGSAPSWPDDIAPVGFLPLTNLDASVHTAFPGAGFARTGGFGVFCNAVGGAPEYQWVSWAEGGGILERVALVVADVTAWNTFRVIVTTATPGGAATAELEINGTSALTREFGTAVLETPDQMASAATPALGSTIFPCISTGGPDGDSVYVTTSFRWGRFLPSGVEVVS